MEDLFLTTSLPSWYPPWMGLALRRSPTSASVRPYDADSPIDLLVEDLLLLYWMWLGQAWRRSWSTRTAVVTSLLS